MNHYDTVIEHFKNAPVHDSEHRFVYDKVKKRYYQAPSNKQRPQLNYGHTITSCINNSFSATRPDLGHPSILNMEGSIRRLVSKLETELTLSIPNKKMRAVVREQANIQYAYAPEFINYAIELIECKTLDPKMREHLIEKLYIKCSNPPAIRG